MARRPQPVKTVEKSPVAGMSRRQLLAGAGLGVAGFVAGGAAGYAAPRKKPKSPPVPDVWIGRNMAECTGCRLCEVACSIEKENKIQPSIARIGVFQFYPGVEFPVACFQCGDEAKCVEACPTDALEVDTSRKLNTIKIDTGLCLRTARNGDCTLCQDECPAGVGSITFHPTTREPLICDLCDGEPACIEACPAGTIMFKGLRLAPIDGVQIAASLAEAYKVPVRPEQEEQRTLTPEG